MVSIEGLSAKSFVKNFSNCSLSLILLSVFIETHSISRSILIYKSLLTRLDSRTIVSFFLEGSEEL